ncbi:hypothetical protein F5B20DRAFT_588719 [Whalleya microplaca]|nr:hypothetical protein F5B20DRAFT_588719 [Whalleya microplaca]
MWSPKTLLLLGITPVLTSAAAVNPSTLNTTTSTDTITFTFGPGSNANGTLIIHPAEARAYLQHELGVGVSAKLAGDDSRPAPFVPALKGAYAFPAGSGVEGAMAWDMTNGPHANAAASNGSSSASAAKLVASASDDDDGCDICYSACIALAILPPVFLA